MIENHFDFDRALTFTGHEALRLVPSDHLRGAEASLPVLRVAAGLLRDMLLYFDEIEAVVWPPSSSVIGKRFFESTVTAWLEGGAFPALGLTAFKQVMDGGLQSVGLDYLIGQELRIEPPLSTDKVEATRLAIRLVNQLVLVGGIEDSERVVAPDGSRLVMRPSRNGKFVRVWKE
jgi:hypothetical protein